MKVYENGKYIDDLKYVASLDLPWDKLQNKSILITGATGLVGSALVDLIMLKNKEGLNCRVYALGRNENKAKERFGYCFNESTFVFIAHDISKPLVRDDIENVDYVIHLASNTHPLQYSLEPIGTITTNIFGTYNTLEFAKKHNAVRYAFASSNEIYGENRGDKELFDESYCGYIDSNTLRAGYPESKRCSEALCQAFNKQENIDVVIPRLTRSYGPTMLMSDTKAISQFIKKALANENIVLKSEGYQYYSYTYVSDALSGLLYVLLKGERGEAYNIADVSSDITLRDLASLISKTSSKEVVFELPDEVEASGYSKATKARLDGDKLRKLGWKPRYNIKDGIERTIKILREVN